MLLNLLNRGSLKNQELYLILMLFGFIYKYKVNFNSFEVSLEQFDLQLFEYHLIH